MPTSASPGKTNGDSVTANPSAVTDGDKTQPVCRNASRLSFFGALERCLHRTSISRIALIPTIQASSVQTPEEHSRNVTVIEGGGGGGGVKMEGIGEASECAEEQDLQSGWDRLKGAFFFNKEDGLSRELYEVMMMLLLGGMMGFVYGGLPASRHARQRYIQQSQASIYHSKLEATGSSYNAASRGMIRYGYRWGWRTGVLAASFHGISTAIAVYRDKQDLACYSAAGVSTGIIYRMNLGLRGMVGGAFVGGLLGIPSGAILLGAQRLMGQTYIERHRKYREEQQAEKEREHALRLTLTPQMMNIMEDSIQKSDQLLEEKQRVEILSSSGSSTSTAS